MTTPADVVTRSRPRTKFKYPYWADCCGLGFKTCPTTSYPICGLVGPPWSARRPAGNSNNPAHVRDATTLGNDVCILMVFSFVGISKPPARGDGYCDRVVQHLHSLDASKNHFRGI